MHEIGKLLARAREVGASPHDGTRLSALLREIAHADGIHPLAKKVCAAVRRLLPCDVAGFLLVDGEKVELAEEDAAHRSSRGRRSPPDALIARWVGKGQVALVEDLQTDHRISPASHCHTFVRSLAAQPIGSRPTRGALVAYWSVPRRATSRELLLLEIIADACDHTLERLEQERARGGPTEGERLNRMVAVAAHDLRNPLSSILSGAEILLRRGELSTRDVEIIRRIRRSADRAARLVSQLLEFSKIEEDQGLTLDLRPVSLDQLCRAVVREIEVSNPDQRIRLEVEEGLSGLLDRGKLADVLTKLVKNALQHADPGEPVEVRVDRVGHEGRVQIHNTGSPIPPETLPQLFEAFRQVRSESNGGSLGLGLFIAQQVVRAHGGRIEVSSTAEEGTTFSVRLPLSPSPG